MLIGSSQYTDKWQAAFIESLTELPKYNSFFLINTEKK
jgi:hypothetical protein